MVVLLLGVKGRHTVFQSLWFYTGVTAFTTGSYSCSSELESSVVYSGEMSCCQEGEWKMRSRQGKEATDKLEAWYPFKR